MVTQADSTLTAIKKKVRRLTASASTSALSENDLEAAINTFYSQDFPYAIKTDQMRDVYTFYTQPNIDRYPLDINFDQSVRGPMYVDGIQGNLFKDRQQFYNLWPKFPTTFQQGGTSVFSFTIAGPFLSETVIIGGVDQNGNPITISDDGNGGLNFLLPNAVTSTPLASSNPAIPGMYNINNGNPGLNNPTNIGTVDYVSGVFSFTLPAGITLGTGELLTIRVSQYQTGRPYSLLFWNNEFTIRPVPKKIHRVEVETYLTPSQFLNLTDNPIVQQWWQYISYGAAMEILRERQDIEGIANLEEGFERQEALVLERQANEEINVPNYNLFNSTQQNYINGGYGQGTFF